MEPLGRALTKSRLEHRSPSSAANISFKDLSPEFTATRVVRADPATMAREHIIESRNDQTKAGIYRAMRAQVLQWLSKAGKRSVAVTSVKAGEGRTLTAVNLAMAIAMDVNQTVLLVDADLRNPSIHKRFGIEPLYGLDDYLAGSVPLASCLVNPGFERLVMLPTREPKDNCAELLASPRMAALTQELKDRYKDRVIIYDVPPLISSGDALGFLPHVESVLLVVRDGAVGTSEVKQARELLKDCDILGSVLNAAV